MLANRFQEADLAVADRASGPEIETQRKPRHKTSLADRIGPCIRGLGGEEGRDRTERHEVDAALYLNDGIIPLTKGID